MRLWTIQDEVVYNTIITEGKYVCDGSKSEHLEWKTYKKAYDWLSKKMKEKIGEAPSGNDYPVWAWRSRPDLRRNCWATKGKKCVLLEIEVDEKDVVITDFVHWHNVINYSPFIDTNDWDEWEREYDRIEALSCEEFVKIVESSWDNIFYDELPGDEKEVQVTFWELRKDQIKNVRFFIAR